MNPSRSNIFIAVLAQYRTVGSVVSSKSIITVVVPLAPIEKSRFDFKINPLSSLRIFQRIP